MENGLQFHMMDLPPQGVDLEGEIPMSLLDVEEDDRFEFPYPLKYRLHLTQMNEDLLVEGTLSLTLRGMCDRCAEYYKLELETNDVCHRYEKVLGEVVDLTDDVREDILIVFPQSCLCKEDCKGLCPVCGANLNEGDCGCPETAESEDEPEEEQKASPWDALDKLNLK